MRKQFRWILFAVILFYVFIFQFYPQIVWSLILVGPLLIVSLYDYFQTKHSVRRNFPLVGHFRYIFEAIRPEINQYFVESNTDGVPFSREQRSLVYQRAKSAVDTIPFGTQKDVYEIGYEWVNHSIAPKHVEPKNCRVLIGGESCSQPYSASIFNISAMSYGAISKNAIMALNRGAKIGGFYHNTGEGSASPYHLEGGGDLVYQIGTGYFGCRTLDGKFSEEKFSETAKHPHIKMIEIKLSQGAKPGHGGILPAKKLTEEIAKIRGVRMGEDVLSPPGHMAFSTPLELCEFVGKLRKLSGGKPVGFKLCVGKRHEFAAICKAMIKSGVYPDFITVDGGEGGTGAAPVEFSNSVGVPLKDALVIVHNILVGFNIREKLKIIVSGKVTTGFELVKYLAMGADLCNSARGMMLALGCIQALRCNTNNCPVGVATQDPELYAGLDVGDKSQRVANFHKETVKAAAEIIGAMGLSSAEQLEPWMIQKRAAVNQVKNFSELFDYLRPGDFLSESVPQSWSSVVRAADETKFN